MINSLQNSVVMHGRAKYIARALLLFYACKVKNMTGLCHSIGCLVFIDHLCMILFFCLDVVQQFSYVRRCKAEEIIVIGGRNKFFCGDAVGTQELVMFLFFRIPYNNHLYP